MDEQYQIEIPQSFLALYFRQGRAIATRATIEARYDLCEDLASQTGEVCHTLQFRNDLTETDALAGCHAALLAGDTVEPAEADWVIRRVAELLQWRPLDLPPRDGQTPAS